MLKRWVKRYHFEAFLENSRMLPLAALTGLIGGVIGALYVTAMNSLAQLFFPAPWAEKIPTLIDTPFNFTISWSNWAHWGVLMVSGLVTAAGFRIFGDPGDTELLVDNIHVHGAAPSEDLKQLPVLIPISLINIASGSGIGPEAPLSQTNGTIGSWIAHRWHITDDEARILAMTGMAAGFTVLFAAPYGAAVFGLELLHRKGLPYFKALIPAITGCIAAYTVYISLTHLGLEPIWDFTSVLPLPDKLSPIDVWWGVAAGIVGALIATGFTYLIEVTRWLYRPFPPYTKPIVTAVGLGALAFASPYALTFSEYQLMYLGTVEHVAIGTLALAIVTKLIAVALSMVGGWKGGFIIPMFFIGYCLGRIAGEVLPGDPNAMLLAACLMVSINVGVTKTPFGSTLVVSEMSGMRLLPPVLISGIVSFFLTSNVYLIKAQQHRHSIEGAEEPSTHALTEDEMGIDELAFDDESAAQH